MGARKPSGGPGQTPTIPAVNASVELAADDWEGLARSRVEDVGPDRVVVARPSREGSRPMRARVGDEMALTWTSEDALYEVPVVLAGTEEDPVPIWHLRPQGPTRRQQRRSAFRLQVTLAAQLGTDTRPAALAKVHDLSEGGLRCTPPSDIELAADDAVWVELPLPEGAVRVDATVVRVKDDGEVGLRFTGLTEAQAERLRSYLFTEQLARRSRLAT